MVDQDTKIQVIQGHKADAQIDEKPHGTSLCFRANFEGRKLDGRVVAHLNVESEDCVV